ncbi:uncharacterized protein LOC126841276 [Adelges cooleyi]|uniref:uncharacterized protein LOC126841276 n=1 Tax=Adelges cooleyi TaxID=133065 RepID=UPI00217F4A84|nr:uncharacterized protein LOC126841276 [Adelges cooleyi]
MITVPEEKTILLFVDSEETVMPSDDNMTNLKHYQYNMGLKIKNALGLGELANDETESLNLETLGKNRRNFTRPAITNIIQPILEKPVYAHRITAAAFRRLCRLTAIYLSATFPDWYITKLIIDYEKRDCILFHGRQQSIYRSLDGIWGFLMSEIAVRGLFSH